MQKDKTNQSKKTLCIAIPTYNEAQNIIELITKIQAVTKPIKNWVVKILIIDDNSPDKTANIVRKLQKKYSNLYLLVGKKLGLGAAYTRGFDYILNNIPCDFIMEMDADLQHNPEDIPRFLNKTSRGYDFIIGSRYIAGGDYPNWSFKRKLYSWGANLIARKIAGIYDIDDCTSGFRCISTKFLKSFDLKTLKANGYAFQMSLLHAASKKKIAILEIPILFFNRQKGVSKLGHKDIREFFINAIKLRFKKYRFRK